MEEAGLLVGDGSIGATGAKGRVGTAASDGTDVTCEGDVLFPF